MPAPGGQLPGVRSGGVQGGHPNHYQGAGGGHRRRRWRRRVTTAGDGSQCRPGGRRHIDVDASIDVRCRTSPPLRPRGRQYEAITSGTGCGGRASDLRTDRQCVRTFPQAAVLVTSSLPYPMELKYEKVMAPFLLLHVNRYGGRTMETEEDAASPETRGSLLVKGVRSMWRQSAPFVSEVLQGSLDRILMKDDVEAAVSYAEGQIWRLLSGRVELGKLAMTGGLWRITGQQVAAAAAAESEGGASGGNGGGAAPPEDVRGPHAALAVRLSHRDPGRRFSLGERLSYVLLAGARTQDDAAEDPLTAAQRGAAPALELYWRNKLQPPLKEIFSLCLSPAALQAFLSGPHTLIRVDASLESTSSGGVGSGGDVSSGGGGDAAKSGGLLAGPGSPQPRTTPAGGGGGGVGGFGLAMTPRSPPPSVHKTRGSGGSGRGGGKHSGGSGGLQSGLSAFFRQTAKCLACKQALPPPPPPPPQQQQQQQQQQGAAGDSGLAPGLCVTCCREPNM
ncbi:hypothetical protein Vafri_1224 [Volvox africanus]|nr:hypothetical protein Vafri_1224 [Volvox africanus]